MRSTVSSALPARVETGKPESLEAFVNRELLPVATKARAVLNYQNIEYVTGDTDGAGTYLTLWASPDMPADATWHIEADVTGVGIGNAERASYKFIRSFTTAAGVLTASPIGMVFYDLTSPTIDAYIGLTATGAAVIASDASLGAMRWTVVVKTTEVLVES